MFDYDTMADLDKSDHAVPETNPPVEEEKEPEPIIKKDEPPIAKVIEQAAPTQVIVEKEPEQPKPEPKAIVPRIPIRNNDVMKNQ